MLSKGKIGTKSRLTIPQMELKGAVMNKRLTEFAEGTVTRKFGQIIHLVGSPTVLCYLLKDCQKLKPFESARVAEIQAAKKVENNVLQQWAWIDSENNPVEWITTPRSVWVLAADGAWRRGPKFICSYRGTKLVKTLRLMSRLLIEIKT